jgi:hypothetical protein
MVLIAFPDTLTHFGQLLWCWFSSLILSLILVNCCGAQPQVFFPDTFTHFGQLLWCWLNSSLILKLLNFGQLLWCWFSSLILSLILVNCCGAG